MGVNYKNKFEIIEITRVPNRDDVLVVLEILEGALQAVPDEVFSPEIGGAWRITSAMATNPSMLSGGRIAVGLDGPEGLSAGMILVDAL